MLVRSLISTVVLITISTQSLMAQGVDSMQISAVDSTQTNKADSAQVKNSFIKRLYKYFEGSNEDQTLTKKIDFSIIGGPHYSSDIGVGIGLVAAGLYRIDRTDTSIPPSNVSLFGDVTSTGFYMLGVRGNTILKSGRYRLDYNGYFFSMPSSYWGIGYANGASDSQTTYKRQQYNIKVDFMYRIAKNTYIGANTSVSYVAGKKFNDINFLQGEAAEDVNVGFGATILYDSRDFIPCAYRGFYVKLEQRVFPNGLGNKGTFARTELFTNYYHSLWKGAVMAYDFHIELNTGDVPWTQLSLMGGSNRMRGYYEGRFRDRGLLEVQAELRQKIYGRSGVATWIGAGNVFPSFGRFDISHTLPTYGIGYRWEFKNRVNVRLDYGFGRHQSGFIFNINEAF